MSEFAHFASVFIRFQHQLTKNRLKGYDGRVMMMMVIHIHVLGSDDNYDGDDYDDKDDDNIVDVDDDAYNAGASVSLAPQNVWAVEPIKSRCDIKGWCAAARIIEGYSTHDPI